MQYIWVTHRRRTSKANSARFHIRSTSRQVPHSRFLAHQRPSLTLNKPMHPISIRLLPQFRKVCINQKRQRASLRSAFAREHGCCIIILFLRFKPVFRATAMLHLQSGHKKVLQRQKSDVRASRDVSLIDCISYYCIYGCLVTVDASPRLQWVSLSAFRIAIETSTIHIHCISEAQIISSTVWRLIQQLDAWGGKSTIEYLSAKFAHS